MTLQQRLLFVLKPQNAIRSVQKADPATYRIRDEYVGAAAQAGYPILSIRDDPGYMHSSIRVLSEPSSDDHP